LMAGVKPSFNNGQKKPILLEQEQVSLMNEQITSRHSLDRSIIPKWKKKYSAIFNSPASLRINHPGRSAAFSNIESELFGLIVERRVANSFVSVRLIVQKMKQLDSIAKEMKFSDLELWIYCFMKRKGLALRRPSRNVTFQEEIVRARLNTPKSLLLVALRYLRDFFFLNMDQTGVNYEMPLAITIEFTRSQSVSIEV